MTATILAAGQLGNPIVNIGIFVAFVIVIPSIWWVLPIRSSLLPLDVAAIAPATSRPDTATAASAVVIVRERRIDWSSFDW